MHPEPEWIVAHLGLVDYKTAHQIQLSLVKARHAGFPPQWVEQFVNRSYFFT